PDSPLDTSKVDSDRRAAEWALKVIGAGRVQVSLRGEPKDIKSMDEVRDAPFRVLLIWGAPNNPLVDDASLANLAGLKDLGELSFERSKITGSGLKLLADCDS